MEEIKNGDYVEAEFEGSLYFGTVSKINRWWKDATVTVAPGITMVLPLSALKVKDKGAGNGTYEI